MARTQLTGFAVLILIVFFVSCFPGASTSETGCVLVRAAGLAHPALRWSGDAPLTARAAADTLWIFDATFEDFEGDNAGWQTFDMSGFPPDDSDYWHKDTIRINGFEWLGDSTWWCGTYCSWWEQPRGYGNYWKQWLHRSLPLAELSAPGDAVVFEWDQRYALEKDYDFGYFDVSLDDGATWQTRMTFNNYGFIDTRGWSVDWDHPDYAHGIVDLSAQAGSDVVIRFRVESDGALSSADEGPNPPMNSVVDGMWQLDNFDLAVNGETVWSDDCEAPGENGWVHHSAPKQNAAGVAFYRALNPETFRGFACNEPTGWMMAGTDSVTGVFLENQVAALVSPPIDVSAATDIAVKWSGWVDTPASTGEYANLWFIESDTGDDLNKAALYSTYSGWGLTADPGWRTDVFGHTMTRNWLAAVVYARHRSSYGTGPYTAGLFTDRLRVGIPVPDDETVFRYERASWIEDTFDASLDDGTIRVGDTDGVASVRVVASADGGVSWYSAAATLKTLGWEFDLPAEVTGIPAEVDYYIEATDSLGNVSTCPADAPNVTYSARKLPITGSQGGPGILVVDKRTEVLYPVDERFDPGLWDDVTDALDILGYEYDLYRTGEHYITHNGPTEPKAYTYYDTHIWLTGSISSRTLTENDQTRIPDWLDDSTFGAPHCLILIGDDIGYNMVEKSADLVGFFPTILEAQYEERHPGGAFVDVPDTTIVVRDAGLGIMDYDDGRCSVRCGCPVLGVLDVIGPADGGTAFPLLEYETGMTGVRSAGTFRVNPTTGATTIIIPFDLRRMTEGSASGHADALHDRVALLGNLLQLVGEQPPLPGTGVDEPAVATSLHRPSPNPFNPVTTIAYALATPGRVTIRVHDAAGRLVRTLVDEECTAGEHAVQWDGTTDGSTPAASGVYFVRMESGGRKASHKEVRKLVLLK